MNRKVFYVECVRPGIYSGVRFKAGDIKKFYSFLAAKHFVRKAPIGMFKLAPPKD